MFLNLNRFSIRLNYLQMKKSKRNNVLQIYDLNDIQIFCVKVDYSLRE